MRRFVCGLAALSVLVSSPATAGPSFILQPVPVGRETVRFVQGIPTLDLRGEHGSVQVTPLPMDHGSIAFTVAVYNAGPSPANIDISSFEITAGNEHVGVFSREELEKKASKRAMWATIALAAAGGLAAAAASSQRDHYESTTYTPHGTYRTFYSAPSVSGQIAATASVAAAGVGIANVQGQLDRTREALGATTVQLTTIDPDDSYAGRIVLSKIKVKTLPLRLAVVVKWNGEAYPFTFQMAKKGTPQPEFPVTAVPIVETQPSPPAAQSVTATPTPTTLK